MKGHMGRYLLTTLMKSGQQQKQLIFFPQAHKIVAVTQALDSVYASHQSATYVDGLESEHKAKLLDKYT